MNPVKFEAAAILPSEIKVKESLVLQALSANEALCKAPFLDHKISHNLRGRVYDTGVCCGWASGCLS
jgi:hypothetical protein